MWISSCYFLHPVSIFQCFCSSSQLSFILTVLNNVIAPLPTPLSTFLGICWTVWLPALDSTRVLDVLILLRNLSIFPYSGDTCPLALQQFSFFSSLGWETLSHVFQKFRQKINCNFLDHGLAGWFNELWYIREVSDISSLFPGIIQLITILLTHNCIASTTEAFCILLQATKLTLYGIFCGCTLYGCWLWESGFSFSFRRDEFPSSLGQGIILYFRVLFRSSSECLQEKCLWVQLVSVLLLEFLITVALGMLLYEADIYAQRGILVWKDKAVPSRSVYSWV